MSVPFPTEGDFIQAHDAERHLYGSAMPRIVATADVALRGRTIKHVGYIIMGGDPWPCLVLDNETTVVIMRDDEGNGPGSAAIHGADGQSVTLCRTTLKG